MRIGKIGQPLGFKGIWENTVMNKIGKVEENSVPIYQQLCIYHPFRDETYSEIEEALASCKKQNATKAVFYTGKECKAEEAYIVSSPILGKPVNFTEDEYLEMENLKYNSFPGVGISSYRSASDDEQELLNKYI